MLQFFIYAFIYGIMMFIWSFVYLNKSNDKLNQSFLWFLSAILLWMVLSVGNSYSGKSVLELISQLVSFACMFNMAVLFLLFIYRLINRRLDAAFYATVVLNTLNIVFRFLYPVDFSDPTFWRLTDPVIAPIMATIFSLPAIFALYLTVRQYITTKDVRLKTQLRFLFIGILIACVVSVISEYVLPTWFHIDTKLVLMHVAILIFVVFAFIAIMKHKLLNMHSEYIYRKLFLNASDGIVLINKHGKIVSVNNVAKQIMHNADMDTGDKMSDCIPQYDFETNYRQHEVTINSGGETSYLTITQYPIDAADREYVKLMTISDITLMKQTMMREQEKLLEKSSIDLLTGLYNKRYFMENFIDRRQDDGKECALLFIDVDDFKSVNDLYGHIMGDRVLKALADCIQSNIRKDEKAIRFGGDEFVVCLEDTNISEAYMVAERIRGSAGALDFSHCGGDFRISLSIGLIVGSCSAKDLITKADMAMYNSKSKGKNRTTVYAESDREISLKLT